MIVEFIGTPGAGKTSLIPVLESFFAQRNQIARTVVEASRPVVSQTIIGKSITKLSPISLRDPLLWQAFYLMSYLSRGKFSKEHPALVSHVRTTQGVRDIPEEERDHNLYWWFHLSGYYQFLAPRLKSNEILLLDEGFAHRVVQLNASDHEDLNQEDLSLYLDLIPKPEILIYVDVPAEECERRVYERGLWPRFAHKSRQQVSNFISNSHFVVSKTVEMLKSRDWDIIEIDNSAESISPVAQEWDKKISLLLEKFLSSSKMSS
jgi:thymidylate kinase